MYIDVKMTTLRQNLCKEKYFSHQMCFVIEIYLLDLHQNTSQPSSQFVDPSRTFHSLWLDGKRVTLS